MIETEKSAILVTGGMGFLGNAIVQELTRSDSLFPGYAIRVLDITGKTSDENNVQYFQGSVLDPDQLDRAMEGCEVVIHSAALVDWGTRLPLEVMKVNFHGTLEVIAACRRNGVKALIYTSSLDAVYTGSPLVDVDESTPYPDKPHSAYCESKALSEQAVLEANGDTLRTCVIRPADVWGEGDPYHISALIDMAKKGFYVRLGNGKSRCQHVYVKNAAHAHLLAAKSLSAGTSDAAGNVYFITDSTSANFFSFFDRIIIESGYIIWPKNLWLSKWFAYVVASISEFIAWIWRPIRHYHPKFSRFAVSYTCTDFTFTSKRAEQDFGFKPKYDLETAIDNTVEYYRSHSV